MTSLITALHMGQLHAYEQWLVVAVAFGPFLVLAAVVYVVRRRDIAAEPPGDEGDEVSSTRPRAT
ncbi:MULTISPECIES: hypothetical protein [unclassified Nocardioides]|uniref:hypothetical protein n=1 Tax=unclassified Nocardioides TaxID=2615069 RepID=UPI0006F5B1F2|nr:MULTISPECIES: hypothetical protein [unclassified Nocardioides]KQY56464.1 hypothetical protein ASD30_08975 [Nocardioides sp. Root140]KQZ75222.1 hypothetical protein ASD66_02285 [Nocardioides sp. Root151]KRF14301.1 hypothetical protein ASH02_08085 [Nocardioides sp. Soil796]